MFKTWNIRLHAISPIHIGCDEVYEPTNFYIDQNKQRLINFDPWQFIASLSEPERKSFSEICMRDNLLEVFQFVGKAARGKVEGREIVVPFALVEHYLKVMKMERYDRKEVINQFTLSRTSFQPHSNLPYIPGSSLKGSLRTAYLNFLSGKIPHIDGFLKGAELEKLLLGGKFDTDPFSLVKISDLQSVQSITSIGYALNRKKKAEREIRLSAGRGDLYQILETIHPGSVFEGNIQIMPSPPGRKISNPVIFENLFDKAVQEFYGKCFEEEKKSIGDLLDYSNKTLIEKWQQKKGAFLVRLGRHSGAEAVTIEDYRQIKIKGKGGQSSTEKNSTTIWLFSETVQNPDPAQCFPFGWGIIELSETPSSFVGINPIKPRVSSFSGRTSATNTVFSKGKTIPPPPTQKLANRPLEKGQTRKGIISQNAGEWVATFEGETRPITIVNPNEITKFGSAEFLVLEASKKEGVKIRFTKLL